jgi:hypothetical protein
MDKSQQIENIRQDFAAFAIVPNIEITEEGKGHIGIKWESFNGIESARINLNDLQVTPEGSQRRYTYKEFLASDQMADLTKLSEMITRLTIPPQTYIGLNAEVTDEDVFKRKNAIELLNEVLVDKPFESTNLIFIRASAGCGKTQTMLKMTFERAVKYRNGELRSDDNSIYLYVNAQGKALANIDEVLAKCLQDLRVRLNYRSVAVLTRNNLLVPVIDGFDELIGSGGYADAFGSLSSFLSSIEKNGAVIATGRSTFYDEHVLRVISNKYEAGESLGYSLRSLEIKPWDGDQINNYLKERLTPEELSKANIIINSLETLNRELLSKPFYCAKFADTIIGGISLNSSNNILDQFMDSFLLRESDKFKNRQGDEILNSKQHEKIMMLVAEEMWWGVRRNIDRETLQEYAVLVAEESSVSAEDVIILRSKMDSYALIQTDVMSKESGWYRFEHDVYYDYFLLRSLINHLNEKDAQLLQSFLTRSLLGESLVEQLSNIARSESSEIIEKWINVIASSAHTAKLGSQLCRNAGTLLMIVSNNRKDLPTKVTLNNIEMSKGNLCNSIIDSWRLNNCKITEVNVAGTEFRNLQLNETFFDRIYVDINKTKFINTHVSPEKEIRSLSSGNKMIYETTEIIEHLIAMGVTGLSITNTVKLSNSQINLIDALKLFLRRSSGKYHFDLHNDDREFRNVIQHSSWSELEKMLRKCGLLIDKKIKRGGPDTYIQHLTQRGDLIEAGENTCRRDLHPDIKCLWDKIMCLN